jgi:type IV secretory pathway TraG/TraD family ATPase VirD4
MLHWYLRQGWPKQLAILAAAAVAVPILWTAIASYLFVDLMGNGLRQYYPRTDLSRYFAWWDYVLTDDQPVRTQRWLALSGAVATLPFVAFIARQVMDYFGGGAKRPAVYGRTTWATRQDIKTSGISRKRKPF